MFAYFNSRPLVRRLKKILIVWVALIILLAALPLDRAYAWSYTPVSGRIGAVSVPSIHIADLILVSGLPPMFTLLSEVGPTVYRSPAPGGTGTQTVNARYIVEKWDGYRWNITTTSGLLQGKIASTGTSYRFPAVTLNPTQARGYFRFTWAIDWYNSSGALLGATYIHSNLASDHVCITPYRLCKTYNGYFRTGGYLTNAW